MQAFDNESLGRMLRVAFDEDLDAVAMGRNYREIVAGVIQWARQNGRLNMLLIEAHKENPDNPTLRELVEATFADGAEMPTFVTGWDEERVANDFFNQILLLNQAIAELRGEVNQLRNDLNQFKQTNGLPVYDQSVSRRMEVLMVVLILVIVFIGLSLRGVI